MLSKPPITEITERVPNIYTLTMAVAKRARQIANKENELHIPEREKALSIAAEDVCDGNVIVLEQKENADESEENADS